ncbi:LysE family translocator [uncultured Erythrobacter sp.]|uniref:LysE family translocator n=1 Tax=uncultured Erythrobacter sp. TaxID=263913 RepID=UPI002628C744|nr:LysE family translocator [uncultured Erythrobacter sp.]
MIGLETLLVFVPIALALNITPGADMLFCLGQGAKSGARAGVVAALGIATGSFIHAVVAGLGLAAFLGAFPLAFEIVRWAGVAYLIFLAIQTLRSPSNIAAQHPTESESLQKIWREGTLVCLLNPKVAIFMLALVPQFVDPTQGSVFVQFLVLGTILNIGGTLICGLVGIFAGRVGQYLAKNASAAAALQYLSSLIFVGLAFKLATDRR